MAEAAQPELGGVVERALGRRHLARDRDVPAAHEERRDGTDVRVETRRHPALDAAHVGLRGGDVLLAREEQRYVDRHPSEDRLLDRRDALARPRDLDEEVRPRPARVQCLRRRHRPRRVVGERRRQLERHPAVDAVREIMRRTEQIGRLAEVLERQLEEQLLARLAGGRQRADRDVVVGAVPDRVVEDRGVRRQPGDRELADVARERAVREDPAGDVVEPEALASVVQPLRRFHDPFPPNADRS